MGRERLLPNFDSTFQLGFDNGLAVFGVIPFVALMVLYHSKGMFYELSFCKNTLMRFKEDKKFLNIVQNNRIALALASNDLFLPENLSAFDKELQIAGYYEDYNLDNLSKDMQGIVDLVNSL